MATFPVKYINNTMRGAPQVSGTVGSLLAAIRAFLLTGFGQVTALSVAVSGGVATATLQAGQSFDPHCVVWVEGATPAELNGEQRVLTASNTSITWATTAADGAATGTIKIKVAPVGQWEEVFTGTNKAVFRSTDVTGPRFFYLVNDTGTTSTRVCGYESMTDIDTGTGPFPTGAQMSGGGYWHKSTAPTSDSVPYALFADSWFLAAAIARGAASSPDATAMDLRGFGDPIALNPAGDIYAAVVACAGSAATAGGAGSLSGSVQDSGSQGMVVSPRSWRGLGSATLQRPLPSSGSGTEFSGSCSLFGNAPSDIDGQIKTSKIFLKDQPGINSARSFVPGVGYIPQSGALMVLSAFSQHDGTGPLAGRRLMALHVGSNVTPEGVALVDLTGPWR